MTYSEKHLFINSIKEKLGKTHRSIYHNYIPGEIYIYLNEFEKWNNLIKDKNYTNKELELYFIDWLIDKFKDETKNLKVRFSKSFKTHFQNFYSSYEIDSNHNVKKL